MSFQAYQWAMERSRARGATRWVLFTLAWHAHADGTDAFLSVGTIAEEAGISVRAARNGLRALEQAGEIQRTGWRQSGTCVYKVVMDAAGPSPMPEKQAADPAGEAEVTEAEERRARQELPGEAAPPAGEPSLNPETNSPPIPPKGGRRRDSHLYEDNLVEWARARLPELGAWSGHDLFRALNQAVNQAGCRDSEKVKSFLEGSWAGKYRAAIERSEADPGGGNPPKGEDGVDASATLIDLRRSNATGSCPREQEPSRAA